VGLAPVLVWGLVFGHLFGALAVFMRTRRVAGTCCGSALRALCRSQQAPATRLLGAALTAGFSATYIVRQTDQKIYLLLLTFG